MALAILSEASPLVSPESGGKGVWRCCLIAADVQGSSGFYPADVLMRDGPLAFPAGTHVYLDHPTETEEKERPERGVLEMAGVLLDDARFEEAPDGRGLFAQVQFFEDVRQQIQQRAPHVGMSIRAAGEVEESTAGRIVRSISEGISVDVVTRAGAGGRLVTMTESDKQGTSSVDQEQEKVIPATSGTGTLLNEVAAMKAAFSDQMEQLTHQIGTLNNAVKDLQRSSAERGREYDEVKESIAFLKKRQESNDQMLSEAKTLDEALVEILQTRLPLPSMIRIAKDYRPGRGQDLHESIQMERDYVKKLRESDRGGDIQPETSMLGVTESAVSSEFSLATGSAESSEIEQFLLGNRM